MFEFLHPDFLHPQCLNPGWNPDWNPAWAALLAGRQLPAFETLWQAPGFWVEPANRRGSGYSGVQRCAAPANGKSLYLKRQYARRGWRSLRHPLRGRPSARNELKFMLRFAQWGLDAPQPLYYAERDLDGQRCALLVTAELRDWHSLDDLYAGWSAFTPALRRRLLRAVAAAVHRMHAHRVRHGALYPKHIFVQHSAPNPADDGRIPPPRVAFIDLENARRVPWRRLACLRDLDTLNRRSAVPTLRERLYFLRHYLAAPRLGSVGRSLARRLAVRAARKAGRGPSPRVEAPR